tara:strand:- start:366 stop:1049 length:684 start_codon:yes stop_codon:yes gene_type:complete
MPADAFLWDTCVIYRWFQPNATDYVEHIKKHLEDCTARRSEIYISTITLAEVRPSIIGKRDLSPRQVIEMMSGSFIFIDTSPDIMSLAGHLRDQTYQDTRMPQNRASTRPLSLGDSIHLATAVALREEFGVQNLTFHTFDQGKRKDTEDGGKTVPMIGFHNWCRDCRDDEEVQKVLSVPKKLPAHPLCPLPAVAQASVETAPKAKRKEDPDAAIRTENRGGDHDGEE